MGVSQTKIGKNAEKPNNVESYTLVGNHRQLTMLVRTKASQKILAK